MGRGESVGEKRPPRHTYEDRRRLLLWMYSMFLNEPHKIIEKKLRLVEEDAVYFAVSYVRAEVLVSGHSRHASTIVTDSLSL